MNPKSLGLVILTIACATAWWMVEVRLSAARDLNVRDLHRKP